MSQPSSLQTNNNTVALLTPISLYDFLGISPGSPPNLIYIAIQKIENADWAEIEDSPEVLAKIEYYLHLAKKHLLSSESRMNYEQSWISYYLPNGNNNLAIQRFLERSSESEFFQGGLRQKSFSVFQKERINNDEDIFDYSQNFLYFIMQDRVENREVFFLNTKESKQIADNLNISFQTSDFYLQNLGGVSITISNDAIGRILSLCAGETTCLPLHIGDRLELNNGTRYILRNLYRPQKTISSEKITEFYLYFPRENTWLALNEEKVYIIGRNTTDIARLPLGIPTKNLCFVNIGRRERSISRQNLQIFYHKKNWYVQDLGSRYGTTLDFSNHTKLETLSGGAIMQLEEGKIRLGYDKSYCILATRKEEPIEKEMIQFKKVSEFNSIYDLAFLC